MATLSSPGIGSGLDINAIVDKLMAVEQQPLTKLAAKAAADEAKISAFGTLKSSLAALQASLGRLATADALKTVDATVSDATVLKATTGSTALPGRYGVEVTKLAQGHKIASAALASSLDVVGTGTLSFDFGTTVAGTFTSNGAGAKTVTIAPGQETLAGIRDAVNAADIGVIATIVNDGGSPGTHLVFSSATTGAANSLKVTVTDGDGNGTDATGLSQLAYDPAATVGAGRNMVEVVTAQDAELVVDGIAVRSATNTVRGAIQGVTLDLLQQRVGAPVVVEVDSATEIAASIKDFVKSFNDLDATFDKLTRYNASTKSASVLTGDGTVRMIQNQLRGLLGAQLGSGRYTLLSQVGVSFKGDGTLAVDETKLDAAIAADPDAVVRLFAATGTTTDSLVEVTGFTAKTVPGTYALAVSQLATRGSLTGQAAAGLTITPGVDDTLDVGLDGLSATITLAGGTYASAIALAVEIQAKINGSPTFAAAGASAVVTASGGVLGIASSRYGSVSSVSASGTAVATLFGGAATATSGVDAAGTLDGQGLGGSGQMLSGATGTAVDGLRLRVIGGNPGARGSVTYQTGIAYRLQSMLDSVLGNDGVLEARTDGLQRDIDLIDRRRDALNVRLAQVEANYRARFTSLDTLLANLSAQSTALTQALATLPKTSTNS